MQVVDVSRPWELLMEQDLFCMTVWQDGVGNCGFLVFNWVGLQYLSDIIRFRQVTDVNAQNYIIVDRENVVFLL